MTAIVSILNKHAVAIAADSAVTFGHKVVNSGNKIFTLSKYHPIAVMTYSNASFMGIPLDTIIKLYRKQLGERELDTIDDYVIDFISFLHKGELFDKEECKIAIADTIASFYQMIIGVTIREIPNYNTFSAAFDDIKTTLLKYKSIFQGLPKNEEFHHYSYSDFLTENKDSIELFKTFRKMIQIPESEFGILLETYYEHLLINDFYASYSGLVFTGFGAKELFPSSALVLICEKMGTRLKYSKGKTLRIGNGEPFARIIPFAQTKVERTIVHGIHPDIKDLIFSSFNNIMNQIGGSISGFDANKYTELFEKQISDYIQNNHTGPLMDTIVNLDKEDMADLAESLVSLTSLMKRVSPEEETVGGPVDVAVISKGDGFIWMKRKHYFHPELNYHFFSNYFRKNHEHTV